jgi:putative ABC transport system permease protein
VDTLLQDLRFAVRSLRRQPGFVAVALATLALGIGTATAMFTVVNGVLLKPLAFHDPAALTMIRIVGGEGMLFPLPDTDFLALRADHPAFERVAVYSPTSFNLTGTGTPEVVRAAWVTGDFFSTLGVQPQFGRFFTTSEDAPGAPPTVVLGHTFWVRRFAANPAAVGQTIRLNGVDCTVVGVAKSGLQFPRRELDLWRNRTMAPPPRRGPFYLTGLARRQVGASDTVVKGNLDAVAASLKQQNGPGDWSFQAVPLTEALVGDARTPLYLLLGAVGILLLIALANVANLLLARAASRQREVAVRVALGAGRARIARQLLTESALLSLTGGALGIALGVGLTGVLLPLGELIIPRLSEIRIDVRVMLFALSISLAAGLLFGAAPALQASGTDLIEPLRDDQRAGTGRSRRALQRSLVVAEIALALMLSVGAGLLIRSLARLQRVDTGIDSNNVLTFSLSLPRARYADESAARLFYDRVIERLQAIPGVQRAATAVSLPPDQLTVTDNFTAEGQRYGVGESSPPATLMVVSESYFDALGIPLIRGRLFDSRDREGADAVVIVNRTLADRYYPNGDAVGRRFRIGGMERPNNPWMRVVGIVGDVKYNGLAEPVDPAFYLPFQQESWSSQYVVIRAAVDPSSLVGSIHDAVWSIDRELPIARVRTMDQLMGEASADSRFRAYLLGTFGALGLILAVIGVYGVMAYAVAQRARELGVRAALGARPMDLVRLVVKDAGLIAAAGVALGLLGAWMLTGLTQKLLFQVTPRDPATFVVTAVVLAGAAVLASWLPARRAGRTDPIGVLRN